MIRLGDAGDGVQRCSRAGCEAVATAAVTWRNPKIHAPDRVKVWLGCDEHRDYLRDFLEARNFPVTVAPLDDAAGAK